MPAPSALPADARRSLFLYNLLFPLVFLALLPRFLLRLWRRGGSRDRFGQRLGFYHRADRERLSGGAPCLWVHSISVGETLMALKLARELHAVRPEARIVLSTTTNTGLALAQQQATDWLETIYNPVDFLPIVRRVVSLLQPERVLLIEGEAWPNLLAECARRGIPVTLVNARLSPRSGRRFQRFAWWTGPIFRLLHRVLVPEEADVARWEKLGVPRGRLRATGSIKFDQAADDASSGADLLPILTAAGFSAEAPLVVAGSTHAGEELALAECLPRWRKRWPALRLAIVPRHVERTPAILRELAPLGLAVVRRSEPGVGAQFRDLLLVDATGELRDWYRLATVVFVGKSLTASGGQNPVEPALLGCPVVVGPHMENFEAVVAHLRAQGGIVQVNDAEELGAAVEALLGDPERRRLLVERAQTALSHHQGATKRAVAAVSAMD